MRKNKILSKLFLGISFILHFVFLVGLFSILMPLIYLAEGNYGYAKLCLICFILSIVIILPLSIFFINLSLDFDPNPPKYEIIDRRDPPYKDWY